MSLYRFTPHTTAKGPEVTGTSGPVLGNDARLRTIMANVKLRQKTHRWSTFTHVESLYRVTSGDNIGEFGNAAEVSQPSTLGEVMGTQRILGKAKQGMWLTSASIQIRSAIDVGQGADNYVTVSMYKDTSRKVETGLESGDYAGVVSVGAATTAGVKESQRSAFLVPETQIRSIKNVDDMVGTVPVGLIHVVLPIEVQYIAGGEYWAFEARPNGDNSDTGWYSATVFLQFAALHVPTPP